MQEFIKKRMRSWVLIAVKIIKRAQNPITSAGEASFDGGGVEENK
jgi:hypothetical protein